MGVSEEVYSGESRTGLREERERLGGLMEGSRAYFSANKLIRQSQTISLTYSGVGILPLLVLTPCPQFLTSLTFPANILTPDE